MRVRTVINVAHWLLTAVLLIFIWLNYQPDPRAGDTVQSMRQISHGLWLYTTQNNDGGATVPIVYRYYLRDAEGVDARQLHADIPFLTGAGAISAIAVDGDKLHVDYSGKVYGIERKAGRYFLTYLIK